MTDLIKLMNFIFKVFSRGHILKFLYDLFGVFFLTGHFLMTKLLLKKMIETAENSSFEGRIVNVSSVIHTWVKRHRFGLSKMCDPKRSVFFKS